MANGKHDPIIPLASSTRLAELFRTAGAEVKFEITGGGHGLEQGDIAEAREWYREL